MSTSQIITAPEIHELDEGTELGVIFLDDGVVLDISTALTKEIKLWNPIAETTDTQAGSFKTDGTDGHLIYLSVGGGTPTFPTGSAGEWMIQGFVELPSGKWHTQRAKFRVAPNL